MTKLINDIKRGNMANCITLHDFSKKKPDLKKWTEYVVDFFEQYGIVPTRLGGHSKTATKNINYKNGIRKLEANNYDTEDIWIGALPPDHNSDMFCIIFRACIVLKPGNICCSLVFDDDIVKFNVPEFNKIASDLVKITGAKYGYIHQRLFTTVVGYEWGVISGLKFGDPESKIIGKWRNEYSSYGSYKTGDLRDIYPINIISNAHIKRDIDGQTLEEWIAQDLARGELTSIGRGVYSWYVAPDDIEYVREGLKHTGIILCR